MTRPLTPEEKSQFIRKLINIGLQGRVTLGNLADFCQDPRGEALAQIPLQDIFLTLMEGQNVDPPREETQNEISSEIPPNDGNVGGYSDEDSETIDFQGETDMTDTNETTTTTTTKQRKPRETVSDEKVAAVSAQILAFLKSANGTAPKKDIVAGVNESETQVTAALLSLKEAGKVTSTRGRKAAWALV